MVMVLFLFFFVVCFMKASIIFNVRIGTIDIDMYAYICNGLSSSLFVFPGILVLHRLKYPIDAVADLALAEEEKANEKKALEDAAAADLDESEPEEDLKPAKVAERMTSAPSPSWAADWDSVPLKKRG